MYTKIKSGLKWSAFSKVISQLVSWVVTIYVIRLLSPGDYGLMAMASVVINFLSTINEFGLGTALVQSRELDDRRTGTVYGAMLLLGVALSLLLALTAPWIAEFFKEPQLKAVIAVVGLQFILNAVTVVPESMMRRDMTFKPLALADLIGTIAGSFTILSLALAGNGVWSLVIGNLIGVLARTVFLNSINPKRIKPNLQFEGSSSLLSYGGYVTAAKFVAYFMSQADILIGAKLLGKDALGLYTVSVHLASIPMDKAMSTVNQVAFSAISRVQDQKQVVRQGLVKGLHLLAYLSLPAILGLASVAHQFIPLVLGEKWNGAVLPLQIVAVIIPLRMLTAFLSTAVNALGHADTAFKNTLTGAIVLPACFLVGVQFGPIGLASAWLVGAPMVFILNMKRITRVTHIRLKDITSAITTPLFSSLIMVLSVFVIQYKFQMEINPTWQGLALSIFSGGFSFIVATFILDFEFREKIISGDWKNILNRKN